MTPIAEFVGALNRIHALLVDDSEFAHLKRLGQEAQAFLDAVEHQGAPVIVDWAKLVLALIDQGLEAVAAMERALLAAQVMIGAWLEIPDDGRPEEIHAEAVSALASLGDKLDAVRDAGGQFVLYRARIQAHLPTAL